MAFAKRALRSLPEDFGWNANGLLTAGTNDRFQVGPSQQDPAYDTNALSDRECRLFGASRQKTAANTLMLYGDGRHVVVEILNALQHG